MTVTLIIGNRDEVSHWHKPEHTRHQKNFIKKVHNLN